MVSLAYTVLERNDSEQITFTDTSTGWTSPPLGSFVSYKTANPTSSQYAITLGIVINSTSSAITYDNIDLFVLNGSVQFTNQSQLVFNISANNLTVGGNPLGTSTTQLTDGIWDTVYTIWVGNGTTWLSYTTALSQSILVYSQ